MSSSGPRALTPDEQQKLIEAAVEGNFISPFIVLDNNQMASQTARVQPVLQIPRWCCALHHRWTDHHRRKH
jgi:hypothetical protein